MKASMLSPPASQPRGPFMPQWGRHASHSIPGRESDDYATNENHSLVMNGEFLAHTFRSCPTCGVFKGKPGKRSAVEDYPRDDKTSSTADVVAKAFVRCARKS